MLILKCEKSPDGNFEKNILRKENCYGVRMDFGGGVDWVGFIQYHLLLQSVKRYIQN